MADNLKGFNDETLRRVSNVGDAIKEIKDQTRDLNRELTNAGGPLSDWESSFNNISNLSRKILNTQDKSLLSSKGTADALKAQNEARNAAKALDVKINELLNQKTKNNQKLNSLIDRQAFNLREAKDQAKILAEEYGNLAESAASLDKRTKFFTLMSDMVKDVKGLRMLASPFEAAAKASRAKVLENAKSGDKGGVFSAGAKAFGGEALSGIKDFFTSGGWIGLLIKAIKFLVDAMFVADERVTKLAKGLMISKDAAEGVYDSFKSTKFEIDSIYNTTKDVTEAFTDLTELTDFATTSTKEMVEAQIILTKNLGLSKEEAFGVQEAFASSNIEADKGTDIIYDQIAAFANQNKLISTGKKVFTDIAKTSKLIQINFKDNLGSLVKTTLEAKKLGLSLDQVRKIGDSLLDFEQSISSELEAELLTGKDINLEKARLYALNHDIAGLTQEITKQGITQEYFANLNVVQQESLAKSLGMSAEEMGDMLYKAKVLEKVGGQDLKNKRKLADELERQGKMTAAINLRNEIAQLEQGILSGKTLEQAEKSTSAQEKFNQSLEQAKEIFSDFVTGGYLDKLANAAKNLADALSEGVFGFITGGASGRAREKREARKAIEYSKGLKDTEKADYEAGLEKKLNSWEFVAQSLINDVSQPITALTSSPAEKNIRVANQLTAEYNEGWMKTHELLTEQNRLLTGLLNKEGTITLNGTKMGTAMAVGGYKVQ